jgi:hypothetical protein
MKANDILIFAAVAVGGYMLLKAIAQKGTPSTASSGAAVSVGNIINGIGEIFAPTGNGWRYFTDGTAISPDGSYYMNGQFVYKP